MPGKTFSNPWFECTVKLYEFDVALQFHNWNEDDLRGRISNGRNNTYLSPLKKAPLKVYSCAYPELDKHNDAVVVPGANKEEDNDESIVHFHTVEGAQEFHFKVCKSLEILARCLTQDYSDCFK